MVVILVKVESVGWYVADWLSTSFYGDTDLITLGIDKVIELGFQINLLRVEIMASLDVLW